jgi:hypothetical protein
MGTILHELKLKSRKISWILEEKYTDSPLPLSPAFQHSLVALKALAGYTDSESTKNQTTGIQPESEALIN